MNDYMQFRMHRAELISRAEEARLAKQARSPARVSARPRSGLARSLTPAADWWRRRCATAAGPGRISQGPGSWALVNDGQLRRTLNG
jgi:hypothetical protein